MDTYQGAVSSNAGLVRHSHEFFEIVYICNTCGAEYLVDSERFWLQRGDIVLIPAGSSHCLRLPENMPEPCKFYTLWFSNDFGQYMSRLFPEPSPGEYNFVTLLHTAGTGWEYLEDMFCTIVQTVEKRASNWESVLFGNAVQILIHLYYCLRDSTGTRTKPKDFLAQIQDYVERHLTEKITRKDVAAYFYVSENTISQTFRKKMGTSFHRYVTIQRLKAAKGFIDEGTPLKLVSRLVGFADYSSFYRAFKQEYSISPEQYRNRKEEPGLAAGIAAGKSDRQNTGN